MYKLSIIVPVYNVEHYLEECIDSLLAQSYDSFEVILVDDGSTDNSGKICDRYYLEYSNVKVIHQNNKGLPFARNAGLDMAEGEYIGFIDSDDVADVNMYKKLIAAIEITNADMAVCNFALLNKQGVRAISKRYTDRVIRCSEDNLQVFFQYAIDSSCNKVYKHEIINKYALRFEDKSIVAQEDFWFLIRYCSHALTIASIPEVLYKYRERRSSITQSRIDLDISTRCIKFIELTEAYTAEVGRNSTLFLEKITLEMLEATVNQLTKLSPLYIRKTVAKFSKLSHWENALLRYTYDGKGLKMHYNYLKINLLRHNLYMAYSFLEYARVRRLRRASIIEQQFE